MGLLCMVFGLLVLNSSIQRICLIRQIDVYVRFTQEATLAALHGCNAGAQRQTVPLGEIQG